LLRPLVARGGRVRRPPKSSPDNLVQSGAKPDVSKTDT
jgi:hypothetical protein